MAEYEVNPNQIRHIAHEIRNQLSICDIYSEIIKKHLIKDNIQNPSIDNALNCIQNAVKLIGNNLIDLKSNTAITLHIVESNKLIQECIKMSQVYIQNKQINIEENLCPDTRIYVDENKLQGCIINIIKNAMESIEERGAINVLSTISGKDLSIRISNNGVEIPEKIQKIIFTDGFTTKNTGSGIGLYLCKKHIESMNGSLKLLKSTQNLTEFEIKVPMAM